MEVVIIDKHALKPSLVIDDLADIKPNGQAVLKVTDSNRDQLDCYIKHTSKAVEAMDFTTGHLNPSKIEETIIQNPFKNKKLTSGEKLFTRETGYKQTLTVGANNIIFTIPYVHCKITGIEIINCDPLDDVSFYVLDSINGDYTGVPNYVLNQYGFTVYLPDMYWKKVSAYDADLYLGMQLKAVYNSINGKDVAINYDLHEVKK